MTAVSEITLTIGVDASGRVIGLLNHAPKMDEDRLDEILTVLALRILGIPINGANGPIVIDLRAA